MAEIEHATPVIPGRPYGLGRRRAPDERDRRFLMRNTVLQGSELRPRFTPYKLGRTLDQGDTSQCVGYSHRHKLDASPVIVPLNVGLSAYEIYKGAQQNDEWDGDNYEGTSVRGAQKFLQAQGYIKSYVWATKVLDVHRFIRSGWGPTNWGTDWYGAMFTLDADGFARPTGSVAGGHAFLNFWSVAKDSNGNEIMPGTSESATDLDKSELWFQNSWGPNWGIKLHNTPGCFKLSWRDAQTLLDADGECAAGIEQKVSAA